MEMQMGRDFAMVDSEHSFQKAHNAGGGFQMAHVGLD